MATETDAGSLEERAPHLRSILVTAIASLAGVAAGVVSSVVASGATPGARATDTAGLAVYLAFAFAGLLAMRLVGVEVTEFSAKDNLYVFFMTFSLWFVTWGILLTSASP